MASSAFLALLMRIEISLAAIMKVFPDQEIDKRFNGYLKKFGWRNQVITRLVESLSVVLTKH